VHLTSIKFRENPFGSSRVVTCAHTSRSAGLRVQAQGPFATGQLTETVGEYISFLSKSKYMSKWPVNLSRSLGAICRMIQKSLYSCNNRCWKLEVIQTSLCIYTHVIGRAHDYVSDLTAALQPVQPYCNRSFTMRNILVLTSPHRLLNHPA
jgi:hypothetical protein